MQGVLCPGLHFAVWSLVSDGEMQQFFLQGYNRLLVLKSLTMDPT